MSPVVALLALLALLAAPTLAFQASDIELDGGIFAPTRYLSFALSADGATVRFSNDYEPNQNAISFQMLINGAVASPPMWIRETSDYCIDCAPALNETLFQVVNSTGGVKYERTTSDLQAGHFYTLWVTGSRGEISTGDIDFERSGMVCLFSVEGETELFQSPRFTVERDDALQGLQGRCEIPFVPGIVGTDVTLASVERGDGTGGSDQMAIPFVGQYSYPLAAHYDTVELLNNFKAGSVVVVNGLYSTASHLACVFIGAQSHKTAQSPFRPPRSRYVLECQVPAEVDGFFFDDDDDTVLMASVVDEDGGLVVDSTRRTFAFEYDEAPAPPPGDDDDSSGDDDDSSGGDDDDSGGSGGDDDLSDGVIAVIVIFVIAFSAAVVHLFTTRVLSKGRSYDQLA